MIDLTKARNKDLLFQPMKKHLVVFDVLSDKSPVGSPGERITTFLTEKAYSKHKLNILKGYVQQVEHKAYDEYGYPIILLDDIK